MGDDDVEGILGESAFALRRLLARWFAKRAPASEIDDLVQDVFLRIIKRGGVNDLDNFQAYAFETASSVLKDRLRSRQTRHSDAHVEFDANLHGECEPDPETVILGREALKASTRVLLELPELTRTIFILRRIEGMPFGIIARRLNLSVSAVEKHMQRATKHLVFRMEDLR